MLCCNILRRLLKPLPTLALIGQLMVPFQSGFGDVLVWDADALTPGTQDGAGAWSVGQPNWFNQTQTLDNQSWVDGSNAVFGSAAGAAGTITLGGPVSAADLTFNAAGSGSYTITGSTLTVESGSVITNANAVINSILAGSNGLAKTGAGLLTLGGAAANTYTGLTTTTAGRLHLLKTVGQNAVTGDLTISGGASVTFGANHQIANTATVTMSDAGSFFNGTNVSVGQFGLEETFANLLVTGGVVNTGTSATGMTITSLASFTGGAGNTIFVGNSGSTFFANTLSLTNMTSTAGLTNNSFTLFGNNTSLLSSITVGAGGLALDGSLLNMRQGGAAARGSRLVLNGNVTTTGSTASQIRYDSGGGGVGEVAVYLSSTAGSHVRTFNIGGGGADLTVSVGITNGLATDGAILKDGVGTLTLSAANTYTGGTEIHEGTLRAGHASALGSGDIFFTGGTLQFTAATSATDWAARFMNSTSAIRLDTNGETVTLSDSINSTNIGGLTKSGAGTLVLSAANDYAGPTTFAGGVTQAGDVNAFGSGDLTFAGGTLQYTAASSGTDWAGRFKNSTAAISLDTNGENVTLTDTIDGTNTGGLTKSGTGTLALAGSNAFTGSTTLTGGTLLLQNVNALAGSTFAGGAGTLSFGNLTAATFGGLSGSSSLVLVNESSEEVELSVGANGANTSYTGVLSGAGSLVKIGNGTLTLSGGSANTYSGLTSVTAGTLMLSKTAGVDAVAGNLAISGTGKVTFGANNQIADTATVTLSGVGSVFNGTGPNGGTLNSIRESFASLVISGGTFNSSAGSIWNIGSVSYVAGANRVFVGNSGSIQTYGSLSLVGMNGTMSSTAVTNGFSLFGNGGATRTTLTVGAGGLYLENSIIYLGSGSSGSALILDGDVTTGGSAGSSIRLTGAGTAPLVGLSSTAGTHMRTFTIGGGGADLTVDVVITDGSATSGGIIKTGGGRLTLAAANSYSGGTVVEAGTLLLDYTASNSSKLSDSGVLTLGSATLQMDRMTAASGTHTEAVLSTTINGAAQVRRGAGSTVVLQMNAITREAGSIDFSGSGIASTDTGNTNGILGVWATIGGNDYAMNSTGGADGLITAYNGYTDVQRLTPGTIVDGAASNVRLVEGAGAAGDIALGSATTTIHTLNQSAEGGSGAATIDTAGKTLAVNGVLVGSGAGALSIGTAPGSGTLMSATAGGELLVQNHGVNALTVNAVIADNTTASALVKTGSGLLALTTANTYTGDTIVHAGTLRAADGVGLSSSSNLILHNTAVFESSGSAFNRSLGTGAGEVTIIGGTVGFSAFGTAVAVNLGGATATVEWGAPEFNIEALVLNAATANNTLNFQNGIDLNGGIRTVRVDAAAANTATISGSISDSAGTSGGLVKSGTGTLILSGDNSYGGTTMLNAGALAAGSDATFGTSTVILNGGALQAAGGTRVLSNDFLANANSTVSGSNSILLLGSVTNNATLPQITNSLAAGRTLTLAGDVFLARDDTTTGRYLQFLGAGATVISGTIANNAFGGTVSSGLFFNGSGTLTLSSVNHYSGRTLAAGGGYIQISEDRNLGVVPVGPVVDSIILAGEGRLRATSSFVLDANRTIGIGNSGGGSSSGHIDVVADQTLTVAGIISNRTANMDGSASGVNTGSLIKSGAGTLILSGANDYTGSTSVTNGLLRINGSTSASSAVNVSAGALGGTGMVNGAVTISGTGGLDLRDGWVGTLTLGDALAITGAAGANNLHFDLNGMAGTTDLISVAGDVSVTNAGAAVIHLNLLGGTANPIGAGTYTLIESATSMAAVEQFALATTKAFGQTFSLALDGTSTKLQLTTAAADTGPAAAFWSGGTDANWSTLANWNSTAAGGVGAGAVPGFQTNVTFSTTSPVPANLSNTLDTDFDINSLAFNAAAGGVTISGTKMLTIEASNANGNTTGNGITSANTSGTNTIATSVGLASSQTWTISGAGGTLVVSGAVSDFGGGNALIKAGNGTLTFSGGSANTYSGQTSVTAGTLMLSKTAGVDAVAGNLAISGTGKVTFGANNQIADTATVTLSGVGSVFNGTGPNGGTLNSIRESFASLVISGGTFNSSAGSIWNIGSVSYVAGANRVFVGNSGSIQTYGSLSLVGMNGTMSSTAVTNGFSLFGNGGATRTTLTVGAGGLYLENSIIYLGSGSSGSALILDGDVTTGGSAGSSIRLTGAGTAPLVGLSSTAGTHMRTFTIGGGGADLTVDVVITDGSATSGGIIKTGGGRLTLAAANSYSGGTVVEAGTLLLDYTASNSSKLSDSGVLTLGSATLQMDRMTAASGTHTEAVLSTTINGAAQVRRGAGSTVVLQMNAITREAGSIDFSGSGIASTDTGNTNGILGVWATIGGNDYAMNSTGGADGLITAYNGYTDVQRLTPGTIVDGAASNVRLVEGAGAAGDIALGSATTTIHTLNQSAEGGSGAATIDTAGKTLAVNGVLVGSGAGALSIGTAPGSGTLMSATAGGELLVQNHGVNALTVNAVIADNTTASALVKTGSGLLALTAANTYTGDTIVHAGALSLADTGSTGTGDVTVASGGAILGTGVIQGSNVTFQAGSTLHAGDGMLSSDHGTLDFTPAAGGGVVSLQGGIILDITSASSIDATFGGNVVGSLGYIAFVNDSARSQGLGSGSHDLLSFNAAGDAQDYTLDFLTSTGTLQVLGSGGFTPESGQIFNLLDWSGVTADFTGFDLGTNYRSGRDSDGNEGAFDLPDLFSHGLLWDVSQFTTSGIIVVVPEPSRALFLLLGMLGVLLRRRRIA